MTTHEGSTQPKIAIVTGASSGMGYATATELARRGCRVIATYNSNPDGADALIAEIDRHGGAGVALALDVGSSETFPAFVDQVRRVIGARWGASRVDYLVNNAGFGGGAPFEETTEAQFDGFMRVILKGPFFLTQQLLPLLNDGGAVVNVTSNSALRPEAGYSAYATMKGGLITATLYMAKELGPRRIRVNGVAPGPTRTRIAGDSFERYPEVIPPLVERTALGRLGEPEDIGQAIATILSDDCGWVTGQNIEVSGGFGL
jgi:NAD(P)-dependent dehydrogenase (short-subunit alcohol dehydrogenase family)